MDWNTNQAHPKGGARATEHPAAEPTCGLTDGLRQDASDNGMNQVHPEQVIDKPIMPEADKFTRVLIYQKAVEDDRLDGIDQRMAHHVLADHSRLTA